MITSFEKLQQKYDSALELVDLAIQMVGLSVSDAVDYAARFHSLDRDKIERLRAVEAGEPDDRPRASITVISTPVTAMSVDPLPY